MIDPEVLYSNTPAARPGLFDPDPVVTDTPEEEGGPTDPAVMAEALFGQPKTESLRVFPPDLAGESRIFWP